jgi:hypothetical protein
MDAVSRAAFVAHLIRAEIRLVFLRQAQGRPFSRWERSFHQLDFDANRVGRSAAALTRKRIV